MSDSSWSQPGTVGTFNFIRRIGFPSTPEISSFFLTLVLLSSLTTMPAFQASLSGTVWVDIVVILLPAFLGELLASNIILRDKVLNFRRLMGLELLAWGPLLIVLPIGAIFRQSLSLVWPDAILLVLAVSLPIRFLTVISLAGETGTTRKLLGSVLVPVLSAGNLLIIYPSGFYPVILVVLIVSIVSATGVLRLVHRIDEAGTSEVGAPPMRMFRAFLMHWLNKDPASLERELSQLGLSDSIRTSVIAFFGRSKRRKGALVISSFHPGPYRDLGSGGLPSLLKRHLEAKFGGVVHVPHGVSGHQSNIITRSDVQKLLQSVESNFPLAPSTAVASSMIRARIGVASASAQVFDHTAFVTLTMSPVDMEDMPLELGEQIAKDAKQEGLGVVIVDAHNSMRKETFVTEKQSLELANASREALKLVTKDDWSGFKTGFAQDPLLEFSLEDGIGPGGLSTMVVNVQGKSIAYLTIDGNNMEPGFRETILSSLRDLQIVDGEVMTTDTHLVTGLVRSPLGYYPVGSGLDTALFLRKVRETVTRAIQDLEDTMIGVADSSVEVRVLGKQAFQNVTHYIGQVGGRVRNLFYLLEAASIIITLVMLVLVR